MLALAPVPSDSNSIEAAPSLSVIAGDPADLVSLDWSGEWRP
jgi:hypothetical protein